jgi:signal transduction histidine kinase
MRDRADQGLRRWALALFGVVVLALLAKVLLASGLDDQPELTYPWQTDLDELAGELAAAAVGLWVVWARPRNPVGWLIMAGGAVLAVADAAQTYGARAFVFPEEGLPFGRVVLALSGGLWTLAVAIPVTVLLVRYPTGVIHGRWARRFDRVAVAGMLVLYVGYCLAETAVTDVVADEKSPFPVANWLSDGLALLGVATLVPAILAIVGNAIWRAVRAERRERMALILLVLSLMVAVPVIMWGPAEWLGSAAFGGILVAVAVGVLRYQALGIEVVVRRALIYATLTGLVLVVFVGVVAGLTQVLPSGPVPQLLAAAVIAVGVSPARDRIQRGIDRIMYGDRGDPLAALTRLGSAGTSPELLVPEVLAALADGLHASGARIEDVDGRVMASAGLDVEEGTEVALELGGVQIGRLRVGPRSGEATLAAADVRLLEAVAPLVAAVVQSSRLAAELGAERARVIEATHSERSRLRQDLHDGLGPSLTGVGLGLEALSSRTAGDPEMVARLRAEVSSCLDEIHRIIDDLRPTALDDHGLVGALQQRVGQVAGRSGLAVVLDVPQTLPEVGPDVEAAAFRIADEALTNVVRHAGAQHCSVSVSVNGALCVVVVDDGQGIGEGREGGVGLASMRARAERLGGRFTLTSLSPGTEVRVELPLEARS